MSETDSPPSETPQEELKGTLNNWGKIQLVDHLRLLADNQQTLDQVNRADARSRELASRVEEARAKAALPELADAMAGAPAEENGVNIYIDSPVSINQPAKETPTAAATPGAATGTANGIAQSAADTPLWKRAAILAAIMAATGGSAGLATYLAGPAAEALPVIKQGAEAIMPPGYGVEVEKAAPDASTPPWPSF